MKYSANDNLEIMKFAKNYNNFLINLVVNTIKKYNFKQVLDYGCSDGFFIEKIKEKSCKASFCGIEIDNDSIKKCKKKEIEIYSEISKTNKMFDLIYSFNVLEHIKDDCKALLDLNKHLNSEGKLILFLPALNFLYSAMDKKTGHFRRYEKKEIKEKLLKQNFKIEKMCYVDCLGVLASLIYNFIDKYIKKTNGDLNLNSILAYDFIFPIVRFFDQLLFSKIIGKNLLIIATKK